MTEARRRAGAGAAAVCQNRDFIYLRTPTSRVPGAATDGLHVEDPALGPLRGPARLAAWPGHHPGGGRLPGVRGRVRLGAGAAFGAVRLLVRDDGFGLAV